MRGARAGARAGIPISQMQRGLIKGAENRMSTTAPHITHGQRDIPIDKAEADERRIRFIRIVPILSIHLLCLGVIVVGWSPVAVAVAVALFFVRMFCITGFYHRYFSHRTFRTHRLTQFVFAFIGASAAQRGPIWWAAHHRRHHRHSDQEPDLHSPSLLGLIWSHTGWFLTERGVRTDWAAAPDWVKFPELRLLERFHMVAVVALVAGVAALGWVIAVVWPESGTSALQMVVWGFGISTTLLYHATFTINSLAHTIGSRRFRTRDDSRNNWVLALITLGEGWHNNHHYYPGSARQGFYWWEIDVTYYILRLMQAVGMVWGVRPVPDRVYITADRHKHSDTDLAEPGP